MFYEDYPGSIVDVTQLQIMLERAKGYGYTHMGFILDRGYFSRENIRFMDKHKFSFVIMVKGMKPLVRELVLSVRGTFEDNRENSMRCAAPPLSRRAVRRSVAGGTSKERESMDRLEYSHKNSYNMMTTQKRI